MAWQAGKKAILFVFITVYGIGLLVLVVGLFVGISRVFDFVYYRDRDRVIAELEKVDGITDIIVKGNDDITYSVIAAQFQLAGRPEAVIEIRSPREGLIGSREHLYLKRLGSSKFFEQTSGNVGVTNIYTGAPVDSVAMSDCIDVGSSGQYGRMLPVKIRDINDLVRHYDELERYFSMWPVEMTRVASTWGMVFLERISEELLERRKRLLRRGVEEALTLPPVRPLEHFREPG